ncbi:Uncharacterized protein FKW44_023929, partial [Caligus rogercresseyi]
VNVSARTTLTVRTVSVALEDTLAMPSLVPKRTANPVLVPREVPASKSPETPSLLFVSNAPTAAQDPDASSARTDILVTPWAKTERSFPAKSAAATTTWIPTPLELRSG